MIKVLFVCTGNICRSPTAEGVFRHLAEKAGLKDAFFIDSAGTTSEHTGSPPDTRAVAMAKKHGVSLAGQTARRVEKTDFEEFHYIYAMDAGHYAALQARAPKNPYATIGKFLDKGDVPDPWYGGEKDFAHAYDLIDKGAAQILKKIREDHKL